jgi:hypothetical protein
MKLFEMIQQGGRKRVQRVKTKAWKSLEKVEQLSLVTKLRRLGFSTRDELNELRKQIQNLEARLSKLEPHGEPGPQSVPQS